MKVFEPGQRVTVLKSPDPSAPNGGYPEGFVPPVFSGTVVSLLQELDFSAAVFRALMDEYPEQPISRLPGVLVSANAEGGTSVELELSTAESDRLLAAHPYYIVRVSGEGTSAFRPDELEPVW